MDIEDFQWTLILGIIGLIIGLLLPSGLDILSNYQFNATQIAQDPAGALTGYVIGGASAVVIEITSAFIGGLFMGIIGLFIDAARTFSNSPAGL